MPKLTKVQRYENLGKRLRELLSKDDWALLEEVLLTTKRDVTEQIVALQLKDLGVTNTDD